MWEIKIKQQKLFMQLHEVKAEACLEPSWTSKMDLFCENS